MWHWQMRHDQGFDTHRDTNTSLWGVINTGPVYLTSKSSPTYLVNLQTLFITILCGWICVLTYYLFSQSNTVCVPDSWLKSKIHRIFRNKYTRKKNKYSKSHMPGMITYHILSTYINPQRPYEMRKKKQRYGRGGKKHGESWRSRGNRWPFQRKPLMQSWAKVHFYL